MRNYLMATAALIVAVGFYFACIKSNYHGVTAMVIGSVMFMLVAPTERKEPKKRSKAWVILAIVAIGFTSCTSGGASRVQPKQAAPTGVDAKVHRMYYRPDVKLIVSVDPMFSVGDTIQIDRVDYIIDSIGGSHGK